MAVRFDADGESYSRALNLGSSINTVSVACWVKLSVDRATTTIIWQLDVGGGSNRIRINAWDGTALTFQSDGGGWFGTIGHDLVVNEWTFIGFSATANPGQARSAVRAAGSTTFAGGSPSQSNITMAGQQFALGDGIFASEWLNGSIAAVKVWDAAMTVEELQNESWTYQPRRVDGLRAWYPLLAPSTVDYSGSGQTLSGGAGAALDDGPPIAWSAGRRRIYTSAATSVTGALAAMLPAATASGSGTVTVSGSLDGLAPAAVADLAGAAGVDYLAGTIPAAVASMAGTVEVSGTAVAVIPAAVAAFGAEVEIPPNDITVTTPGATREWAAGELTRSWSATGAARGWTAGTPTT